MTYKEWDFDERLKDLEDRLDKSEKFIEEVQSGKRVLLWLCMAIAGLVATVYYAQNIVKGFHG